jgi:hypothetical protein
MSDPAVSFPEPKLRPFSTTSRYYGIETAQWKLPDGTMAVYVRRRFVPSPERFETISQHTVTEDDRIDNITAKYFGDAEQFWRVCDANNAMHPRELTQRIGGKIRITLPEGITSSNA